MTRCQSRSHCLSFAGWPVHWYGLLIGLGMVLSYLCHNEAVGLSEDRMLTSGPLS